MRTHLEFRREILYRIGPFFDHSVATERGRQDDDFPHLVRVANRTLHRHGTAHAIAHKVRSRDLEKLEQCGHVVGEVFVGEISWDVLDPSLEPNAE